MSAVDPQLRLRIKPPMQSVDLALVRRQPSLTAAIKLAATLSGLNEKKLCAGLRLDPAQWSRIKNGEAHFPQDRLELFMDLVQNEVPLLWLADRRGYALEPLETELERRLRLETEARQRAEERLAYLENLFLRHI